MEQLHLKIGAPFLSLKMEQLRLEMEQVENRAQQIH